MILGHWFWFGMTMVCIIWYSTITIYVAIKGYSDIKGMLKRLAADDEITQDSTLDGEKS